MTALQLHCQAAEIGWRFYSHLAEAAFHAGQIELASELLAKALALAEDLGNGDPRLARTLNRMGVLRCQQERYAEAANLFRRATAVLSRATGDCARDLGAVFSNLASTYRMLGLTQPALVACRRALSVLDPSGESDDLSVAWNLDLLGEICGAEAEDWAALSAFRRALAIKERMLGTSHWDTSVTLRKMGEWYFRHGRFNEAAPLLWRFIEIQGDIIGRTDISLAGVYSRLGELYTRQGKCRAAELLLRYSLALFNETAEPPDSWVVQTLQKLAEAYRGLGRFAEAEAVAALARRIAEAWDQGKTPHFEWPGMIPPTPTAPAPRPELGWIEFSPGQ
ncbi:MAG: tetratricopeptide repeat protein [Acidobacteriota bacterium]